MSVFRAMYYLYYGATRLSRAEPSNRRLARRAIGEILDTRHGAYALTPRRRGQRQVERRHQRSGLIA